MKTRARQLKSQTMRKVYGIWFFRQVLPLFCLEVLVFASIVVGAQSYISFGHVVSNVADRVGSYQFWVHAVMGTELISLVLLLGAFVVAALIARDTIRMSRNLRPNFLRLRRVI